MHYHANGSGRDTYINRSSGGFYKPYAPLEHPKNGPFYPQRALRPRPVPNPVMEAKPLHYAPDGSGRDRYIE